MSERWPGGLISRSAPAVVGPTGGEGGSAPGIWTINQIAPYVKAGTWPQPLISRQLWSWGENFNGQLGLGTSGAGANKLSPNQVGSEINWLSLSGGGYHTAAIKRDGTLWAWGRNSSGQLGDGTTYNRSSPVQIGALTTWYKVGCGTYSTIAIKTDGTLWSWGSNSAGQLGLTNTINQSSPIQVGALTNWLSVACGYYHTLAVKTNGTLWTWGLNNYGQLGQNIAYYINKSSPVQVGALTTWLNLAGGYKHTVAVKTDGTLWSWGDNSEGQLGLNIQYNISRSSPVQIGALTTWSVVSASQQQSSAVKTDGTLWTWGRNHQGQLGQNDLTKRSSPTQVGGLTNWLKVSCTYAANLAIKTDGTLWSFGVNSSGQLGIGTTVSKSSPVQVGALTTWNNVFPVLGSFSLANKS